MAIQKIAVLGGGMGSLTSVFKLTSDPEWQSKYEITVYQMGWRLGGKGASGRNGSIGERIEEHGLHLWFGFYDNAFNLIQQVYLANNREPGTLWPHGRRHLRVMILYALKNRSIMNGSTGHSPYRRIISYPVTLHHRQPLRDIL